MLARVLSTTETSPREATATLMDSSKVRLAEAVAVLVPWLMSFSRPVDWITMGRSFSGFPSETKLVTEELSLVVASEMVVRAARIDAPSARTLVLRAARGRMKVEKRMVRDCCGVCVCNWVGLID